MAETNTSVAMSFGVPNYSGLLYTKSNIETPFLNAIGAPLYTNSVEFATSQDYALEAPSQPAISEADSVKGVDATFITRSQKTNVTQIFQEAVCVSYAKQSNMGTLSGINIAGQTPNPIDELQFQKAAKMRKIANSIEYTFINGVYNKATADNEVNKTRGILAAIETNAITETSKVSASIMRSSINNLLKRMYDSGVSPDGNTLFVNSAIAAAITEAFTGTNSLYPNGATTAGAAYNGMIFGQIGLDYGVEYLHGKLVFAA